MITAENGTRRQTIFNKIFVRIQTDIAADQSEQQAGQEKNKQEGQNEINSQQDGKRQGGQMQNLSVGELKKIKNSFMRCNQTQKRARLNAILQSQVFDYDNQDNIQVIISIQYSRIYFHQLFYYQYFQLLIESIQNDSKTILEAKFILLAFQSLHFFKNKSIFQISESLMHKFNEHIQIRRFQKYQHIFSNNQNSDKICIVLQGEVAILRLNIRNSCIANKRIDIENQENNDSESSNDSFSNEDIGISKKSIGIDSQLLLSQNKIYENKSDNNIEYQLLKEQIEQYSKENTEILRRNYANVYLKKDAIGKYLFQSELLKSFKQQLNRLKQNDTSLNISKTDTDYFTNNYPQYSLTRVQRRGDSFGETFLINETRLQFSYHISSSHLILQLLQFIGIYRNGEIISLSDQTTLVSFSREGIESMVYTYYLKLIANRISFLKQFKFIEPLMERDILNIIPDLQELQLSKNNTLYKEGDKSDTLFFLMQGEVELKQSFTVQELNEVVNQERNQLRESIIQEYSKKSLNEDISNNKIRKSGNLEPNSKFFSRNLSISTQIKNKDVTKLNKLALIKDNIRNTRLVTLYQFGSGSFCGDKEFFEEQEFRKTRAIVLSHQAIVLSIKTKILMIHLKMNRSDSVLKCESSQKNVFYAQRIIDYTMLNQNLNKKQSYGISELIQIINKRKKLNTAIVNSKEASQLNLNINNSSHSSFFNTQLQSQQRKQSLIRTEQEEEEKEQEDEDGDDDNQDEGSKKKQVNDAVKFISKQTGNRRDSKNASDKGNKQLQEFQGMDQLNKSILKKMNIKKQSDSIFDESIPNYLKEIILRKLKQLNHLTPAAVKAVIKKVIESASKLKTTQTVSRNSKKEIIIGKEQNNDKLNFAEQEVDENLGLNQIHSYVLNQRFRDQQLTVKRRDSKNQSGILIRQQYPEIKKGYITFVKKQSMNEDLISKLSDNSLVKMQKSFQQGKQNFHQIFLQSFANQEEVIKSFEMLQIDKYLYENSVLSIINYISMNSHH